jgi:hypothetical protein
VGQALIASSVMMCPHGGTVTPIPSSSTTVGGVPIVVASDNFMIAGCSLTSVGSPCVLVQWIVPSASTTANGAALLTTDSVGLCISAAGAPQGSVVIAAAGQARVTGN